ncbi:MAG TPA: hypothetical protein VIO56_01110 [Methylotenera sp.]|jgi:hypothetical protein
MSAIMLSWLRSEAEVLKRIASNRHTLANTIHFALDSAFPYPENAYAQDVFIGINIPRDKLQLAPDQRPGDIDYLIVPFSENEILFERTIAIEAKVVRPSVSKPGRNTNTMGRTQATGLLRDGFPFVGLVHISVPEPLPSQMHRKIPVLSNSLGPNGELLETGEYHLVDPFPLLSAKRQEGRVLALDLPKEIGYRVIAMTLSDDGEGFCGNTVGQERRGARNPIISNTLIKSVQELLTAEPHLFEAVRWYG